METMVLEDWLRAAASSESSASTIASTHAVAAPQFPAKAIVHAWSQIRGFLQQRKELTSADSEPFDLLDQHRRSLHLADSQAKLLQALLSNVSSSDAALLGFVRRFAVLGLLAWIRKSFSVAAPSTRQHLSPIPLESVVQSVLKAVEERPLSDHYVCEVILLLGTISKLRGVSAAVRNDCLSVVARELVGRRDVITSGGAIAEALAGAGYSMVVSSEEHLVPIVQALLLLWSRPPELLLPSAAEAKGELNTVGKSGEQKGSILKDQTLLLHLMDFLGSNLLSREKPQTAIGASQVELELIHNATVGVLESNLNNDNRECVQCSAVMASVGLLRSLYRWDQGNKKHGIPSYQNWLAVMRNLENILIKICEQAVAPVVGTVSTFGVFSRVQARNRSLCRWVSVGVSRCRGLPAHPSILRCLVFSVLEDALSLDTLYSVFTSALATGSIGGDGQQPRGESASEEEKVSPAGNAEDPHSLRLYDFQAHVDGFLLKEIGAIARAMCDQYRVTDADLRGQTEQVVSEYARKLYEKHRLLVAVSQTIKKQGWSIYRQTLEKVLETAFLTVVIFFFLAVDEQEPGDNGGSKAELAALALDALSCVEFFRHVQLREFSKVVQRSVTHIAWSEAASVLLARLLPPYEDIIKKPGSPDLNLAVSWEQDEVQTSRLLFYLRVLPLCLIKMPEATFAAEIAPAMFLYLQHPSETVSQASHALFAAFLSFGVNSEPPMILGAKKSLAPPRAKAEFTVREQLVVYYIQRALQGFPELTPFQGLVVGAGAIARHLPPGSPATVYCLTCLVDKTATLYCVDGSSRTEERNDSEQSQTDILGGSTDDLKKSHAEEVGAAQKLQILLLHLVLLVDVQVLPVLLKLLAKLILGLPKHFQTVAVAEAYDVFGFTDDYTRKPITVPWLQSLSFLTARSQRVSNEGHPLKDQASSTSETRLIEVGNPETISKSRSVGMTSNDKVRDNTEEENQSSNLETFVEDSKVSHPGDTSTRNRVRANDQARLDDKGLEPRSRL